FALCLAQNFFVILLQKPSICGKLHAVVAAHNIVIRAFCKLTTWKWRIAYSFPVMLSINMYPSAFCFIARAVIYLIYFLSPGTFFFFRSVGQCRPIVVAIKAQQLRFFILPVLSPMLNNRRVI